MAEDVLYNIKARDEASRTFAGFRNTLESIGQQTGKVTGDVHDAAGSFEKLGSVITNFAQAPLRSLHQGLGSILGSIGPLAIGLGTLAGGVLSLGSALFSLGREAARTAEQLRNVSVATGLTTQQVQALERIAKEAGLEGLNFARSLGMLNRQLEDTSGSDFVRVLNSMRYATGEAAADLQAGIIPLLDDFRARLLATEDSFIRARLANAAFGRGLRELIPIILDESRSLSERIDIMIKAKATWDEETQRKLKQLDDGLDELGRTWEALAVTVKGAIGSMLSHLFRFAVAQQQVSLSAREIYEQWAKTAGEKGELPQFPAEKFHVLVGSEQDPLRRSAEALARAKAIASGRKEDLDLVVKIGEMEERFDQAVAQADVKRAEVLAREIAQLKQSLRLRAEARKAAEDLAKEQIASSERTIARIDDLLEWPKPWMGLIGAEKESEAKIAWEAEQRLMKAAQQDYERRQEAEERLRRTGEEAREILDRRYTETFEHWKDMAGHVFDAMLTSGKSVFANLAEFARSIFLTKLRDVFQNVVAELFTNLEAKGGILGKIFAPSSAGMIPGLASSYSSALGSTLATGMGTIIPAGTLGAGGTMALSGWSSPEAAAQAGIAAGSGKAFAMSTGGQLFATGGLTVGTALVSDAFRRGSKLEGAIGGGLAGASMGMMLGTKIGALAGPVGMAVGAGVGALAGLIVGLVGGGEKRREEERQRRAEIQSQYYTAAPGTISRMGAFGIGGGADIEADLLGRVRVLPQQKTEVTIRLEALDVEDFERRRGYWGKLMSKAILAGQGQLADNIAWAAE